MKKLLVAYTLTAMLLTGSMGAFAADEADQTEKAQFVCPNGNENCINNGECTQKGVCTGTPKRDGTGGANRADCGLKGREMRNCLK